MAAQYNNVGAVSLALGVWLARDEYDHNSDPNTISASTLLRPIRQIILPSRIPSGEALPDLVGMFKSRMGTALHNAIEDAWLNHYAEGMAALGTPSSVIKRVRVNPTDTELAIEGVIPIYLERRASRKLGKWTVTGKFDFVGQGIVQDFKSTSIYAYQKQTGAIKYVEQGSIYRWLNPRIITADTMQIHYMFTDWKQAFVKTDPNYPSKPVITQHFDLLSHPATDTLISNKLAAIDKYWDADEADIPHCTADDLWRSLPQFKYYKNGDTNAKRSTKNFASNQEAVIYMSSTGKGAGAIKEVPGQVTACKWCPAFTECTQKDAFIRSGELIIG